MTGRLLITRGEGHQLSVNSFYLISFHLFFLINYDFYKGQRKGKDSSLADSSSTSIFPNFCFLFVNTIMVMLECFS